MNVYVLELIGSLARAGVSCEVFVRRWAEDLADTVLVEPGFRVHHVDAGPPELEKSELPGVLDEFTDGVHERLREIPVAGIHAHYWLSGIVGHALKHELDLPLATTFHTLGRVKSASGDSEPRWRVEQEESVIGCSDAIVANASPEVEDLVNLYGADPSRIEVVSPGVDHSLFSPGDQRGARAAIGEGPGPLLLFVGRIQPLKGLDIAIGALAELADPQARLVVVGGPSGPAGGQCLDDAKALAEELGVASRVRWVPPQPHHLLSSYYRAADVCVVPSRSESFGLVALEAAACGRPVVAADVGGLRTLVDHGCSGFLVAERTPAAFAEAVDEILDSPPLAASMRRVAHEQARAHTWSASSARLRRLYSDLRARSLVRCP